jgi:hypothetical protein
VPIETPPETVASDLPQVGVRGPSAAENLRPDLAYDKKVTGAGGSAARIGVGIGDTNEDLRL